MPINVTQILRTKVDENDHERHLQTISTNITFETIKDMNRYREEIQHPGEKIYFTYTERP